VPIEDNFWEIGAGPSGPDTEIFFDRGEVYDPEHVGLKLLAEDIENDRYIEIWNIVLSQFNADPSIPRSEYPELPQKNIDTGMGLERMVCIIQGGKQTLIQTYSYQSFVKLKNYLEKHIVQTAKI
jgi:alanyl-tRNA synthetase (EC 6.1.1.7)